VARFNEVPVTSYIRYRWAYCIVSEINNGISRKTQMFPPPVLNFAI